MPVPGWYYRLSHFFREKFGEKVYKIPLDAGFSCPNRDGTISAGGCIYCYNPSFSPQSRSREVKGDQRTIREQILLFQQRGERRKKIPDHLTSDGENFVPQRKYLAYFQSYTNTYGDIDTLRKVYDAALSLPGIVGLSIATRPDCLDEEKLTLLESYARDYHIWLEIGLQSAHNRTLKLINRGHTFEQFVEAVNAVRGRKIYTCAHIINGLPGEKRAEMLETVVRLSMLPVQGIKFHQLQVLKGTPLAQLYHQGRVDILTEKDYLEIVCDQLELLRSDIVVHRLLSEVTDRELLLVPRWQKPRSVFSRLVEEELKCRGTFQGSSFQKY